MYVLVALQFLIGSQFIVSEKIIPVSLFKHNATVHILRRKGRSRKWWQMFESDHMVKFIVLVYNISISCAISGSLAVAWFCGDCVTDTS